MTFIKNHTLHAANHTDCFQIKKNILSLNYKAGDPAFGLKFLSLASVTVSLENLAE
ncbi:MAG: hypothetical protein HQL76_08280 [Magnetococcales bacterium]|nr:hypothetical protein [Magnetococcales bacterium]